LGLFLWGKSMPKGAGTVFWLQPLLDLLFPSVCIICGESVPGSRCLCGRCFAQIRYPASPLCVRCGTVFPAGTGGDHLCGRCLRKPPPFALARAVAFYAPPVDRLLHRLKFRADRTVVSTLADIAAPFDRSSFSSSDLILPVPLHLRRLQHRGMNQSLILARALFPEKAPAIRPDVLVRTRNTPPQTSLDRRDRLRNLTGAFAVSGKMDVSGLRICLVDDILTTGTTVTECADVLMRAGAEEVRVLAMARVAGQRS
jgi:ComF family protein